MHPCINACMPAASISGDEPAGEEQRRGGGEAGREQRRPGRRGGLGGLQGLLVDEQLLRQLRSVADLGVEILVSADAHDHELLPLLLHLQVHRRDVLERAVAEHDLVLSSVERDDGVVVQLLGPAAHVDALVVVGLLAIAVVDDAHAARVLAKVGVDHRELRVLELPENVRLEGDAHGGALAVGNQQQGGGGLGESPGSEDAHAVLVSLPHLQIVLELAAGGPEVQLVPLAEPDGVVAALLVRQGLLAGQPLLRAGVVDVQRLRVGIGVADHEQLLRGVARPRGRHLHGVVRRVLAA
mmetsp:Transcript_98056/g.305370  ORF Transcript_98056/g.305370 Transcript_98056/m.305370 type:complete len:297 (-) Transcript_98056:157-1047(-)